MLHPNRMLDSDKSFGYEAFLDTVYKDFTIIPGDQIELYIFPNGGYNLIESQITTFSGGVQPQTLITSLNYLVDADGQANLPRLGFVKIGGMTEREVEQHLSAAYEQWYNDAFVNVYIKNKYVTVYRGSYEAKRVELTRPDITLMEAIGLAGGIPESGKSGMIKVVRNTTQGEMIQHLDLRAIEGITPAMAYVQPGDIIYIEPSINSQFFREIAPIISTVSGIAVIYAFFVNLSK